ncbi:MAG: permease-like cell division protein FtsX [Clostridia bacterium]|nr:permease-like cell division protein FtsX [Clostridia bacterium]
MKRYNLFYFIGQALSGLWRNGVMSIASIAVLMSCLVVIGGFALLVMTIDVNLEQFGLINEIVVYCNTEATEEEILTVGDQIRKLDNIESVTRVTKAEGLAEMKEKYDKIYDDVDESTNPLPDKYVITFIDTEKVPNLTYQLNLIEGITKVNDRLELASKIENVKSAVMLVFVWFLAILAVVSVFIIINTIKLSVFARRNEISIMRYVGATGWFISLPFVIEGIIIGLFASISAYFIEWYIYSYIETMFTSDLQMITIMPFPEISNLLLYGFLVIGVITGIIGSSISLSKYLRQ